MPTPGTTYGDIAAARHSDHLGRDAFPPSRPPASEYALQPARARALHHTDTDTTAQRASKAAQHCVNQHLNYLRANEKALFNVQYSDAGIDAHMKSSFGTDAYADVEATTVATVRAADVADTAAQAIRAAMVQPGDAADEVRADRAWRRAEQQLKAAPETSRINTILKLVEDSSDGELSILVEELPHWMAAHNMGHDDATAILDEALSKRVPPYGLARAYAVKARQAAIIAQHDLRSVQKFLGNSRPASDGLYHPVALARYDATFDPDAR